jgi:elongator complex protein 1
LQDELAEIGLRVAGKISLLSTYIFVLIGSREMTLSSKKRYAEAATVLLDYAGDVRQAVIAYVEGNFFADARRIVSSWPPLVGGKSLIDFLAQVSLRAVPELVEEIIHPGALETKSQLVEDLGEMKSQLSKQVARVRELRVKKVEQPGMELPFKDRCSVSDRDDGDLTPTLDARFFRRVLWQ